MTIVEKIHAEIDSAQDRILNEANEILSSKNEKVLTQAERLRKLGFDQTPLAKEGEAERLKREAAEEMAERVKYYSREYPFLKFITKKELDRICKKYNLIYSSVDRYIKDIPEKNLQDIERAQPLKRRDSTDNWVSDYNRYYSPLYTKGYDAFDAEDLYVSTEKEAKPKKDKHQLHEEGLEKYGNQTISSELFIAAPKSHFNLKGLKKKGFGWFKPEPKDPIVFRYVRGGIQIITKWGEEANDPSLILPQDN